MRSNYKTIILTALSLLLFASCEKDLPVYSDHQAYLNFTFNAQSDSTTYYSFVYSGGKQKDTVWIELETMGFLSDNDRSFELQQVPTGNEDAQAGRDYVSFDSEEEKPYLVVPAGKTTVRVPIFVLRNADLKNKVVNLLVEVKPNDNFKPGYKQQNKKLVTITDQLTKPTGWTSTIDMYFGQWGPVKHQFMIDVTGENWDNEYIESIVSDYGYVSYLESKLNRALDVENARRSAEGLPPLQEADGTLVAF